MFTPQTNLLEIVVRVVLVYVALTVLLRLGGKKELGDLTPMNLLAMLLLSETVSPAITRQDPSIVAGLVAAATLLGLTVIVDRLTFRFRAVERLLEGQAAVLIEDGKVVEEVRRRERITEEQLKTALRDGGVPGPEEVERAFVEPTGRISVVARRREG